MALWCRDLPHVIVPKAAPPKRVTLVYPFYENHAFFAQHLDRWRAYPDDVKRQLAAVVVDDGSPRPLEKPIHPPFPIRVFRIEVDVRWNWLAARNIGAQHAEDGWLLLTDMDHVVPAKTVRAIVDGAHDPAVVYAFGRCEHTGVVIAPHSASFLMTRAMFWRIGGYDEALSGHYGTDGEYRRRVARVAPIHVQHTVLLERHEYQGDSSTLIYRRKQPEDARVAQLVAARGAGWRPRVLSFPYHEVAA